LIFNIATKDDIDKYTNDIQWQFDSLRHQIEEKPDKLEKDAYERIADLEVKMAKLWSLLIEKSHRGEDKLTKFGRKFGGMARRDSQ